MVNYNCRSTNRPEWRQRFGRWPARAHAAQPDQRARARKELEHQGMMAMLRVRLVAEHSGALATAHHSFSILPYGNSFSWNRRIGFGERVFMGFFRLIWLRER
jgi:hypothetical protein